jgi:hypothetical protein
MTLSRLYAWLPAIVVGSAVIIVWGLLLFAIGYALFREFSN